MPTVYDRVKDIVVDKLGVDEGSVAESSAFVDDLGADSLDLVELLMAFEEEFTTTDRPIEISDDDAGKPQYRERRSGLPEGIGSFGFLARRWSWLARDCRGSRLKGPPGF